jgi:hypothetical protein
MKEIPVSNLQLISSDLANVDREICRLAMADPPHVTKPHNSQMVRYIGVGEYKYDMPRVEDMYIVLRCCEIESNLVEYYHIADTPRARRDGPPVAGRMCAECGACVRVD